MAENEGIPTQWKDMQYLVHRIYHDYNSKIDQTGGAPEFEAHSEYEGSDPYRQDVSRFPEMFKSYGENYDLYERARNKFQTETPGVQKSESPFKREMPKDMGPWDKKFDDFMPRFRGTGP